MKAKMAVVCAMFSLLSAGSSLAQSCSNWSPKFDHVTNPEVLQKLRQTNWDQIVQQGGGPEQMIASLKTTRKDAEQRLENSARAAEATKGYAGPVNYDVTWAQCKNNNMGAHMAAVCEHLNMSEMILTLDGTIELLQCREGQ